MTTASTEFSFSGLLYADNALIMNNSAGYKYFSELYQINIPMSGYYHWIARSNIGIRGYLYKNEYNPNSLATNLIAYDDPMNSSLEFYLQNYLLSNTTYILVVIGKQALQTGIFIVNVIGPSTPSISTLRLTTIQPITGRPSTSLKKPFFVSVTL